MAAIDDQLDRSGLVHVLLATHRALIANNKLLGDLVVALPLEYDKKFPLMNAVAENNDVLSTAVDALAKYVERLAAQIG